MSITTDIPKLTYSVPEACKALQISRTTLWKLVKARKPETCADWSQSSIHDTGAGGLPEWR